MPSQTAIRDEVTARIVAGSRSRPPPLAATVAGDRGRLPARRHSNVASRKAYQGVNPLLLEIHALRLGLLSRWWGTFNQWHQIGCRIRRRPPNVEEGHWGCRVVFWKPLTKTVVDDQTGDEDEERFFVLKTFTVFCADQVEGEAAEQFQVHEDEGQPDAQPDFQPAEELIAATGADIRYGGDRAYLPPPDARRARSRTTRRRLHRAAAQGDLRPAGGVLRDRRPRTRPLGGSPNRLGPRQAGLRPRANWRPRSPPATSPPNSASRRARGWATTPPTCGAGLRR